MLKIAIVGLGNRAMGMFKTLRQVNPQVTLKGLVDPDPKGVRERMEKADIQVNNVLVMDSVQSIIKKRDQFDGILVGTRCFLHTPMAVELAKADLPVFLEKPVAINNQQLEELAQAYKGKEDRVVVSFPLRITPLFTEALDIIRSGRLGTINQIQAFNDVPYGDIYFRGWYRSFEQTGGLWLQKATHDVDCINRLANARPTSVAAMISRQTFDDPATASFMENAKTSSPMSGAPNEPARHQDAGSAIFMYDNGLHAAYSQNFVTRKIGRRGATVTGHLATLHFDWHTGLINIHDHYKNRTDRIEVKAGDDGHLGGDHALARNFIALMQGKEKSNATLHDGLLSAAMCLAARESANTHTFQPIVVPGQSTPEQGPRAREDRTNFTKTQPSLPKTQD